MSNYIIQLNYFFQALYALPMKKIIVLLSIILICGCSATIVSIDGTYPAPLVNKLPLSVGVYYSDELSNFQYIEINENNGKEQYIINGGFSQLALFNSLLPAIFERVVYIEDINAINDYENLDMIFIPEIKDFQAGFPKKTRLNAYEIWIQYNMRLNEGRGDYIHDWNMSAYGKASTSSFGSVDDGITEATNVALRDLSASFALSFTNIPAVNEWLIEKDIL